jgi:hypothetical protein
VAIDSVRVKKMESVLMKKCLDKIWKKIIVIINNTMTTPPERGIEEFKKDLQSSFNCLFIWWVNGAAFGLGFLVVMKISELWTM